MNEYRKAVVCVGGLDTTGGAGLAADIRAAAALRVPCRPIAAVLAPQDENGISKVFPVPEGAFTAQLRSIDWSTVGAVKLGAVFLPELLESFLDILPTEPALVIDPLLGASAGGRLSAPDLPETLRRHGFPRAVLVTFNRGETRAFFRRDYDDALSAEELAIELAAELGCAVLLKGGHLPGEPVDHLALADGTLEAFPGIRSAVAVRGTGCMLATAIVCGLASGINLTEAVARAKSLVNAAVECAYPGVGGHIADPRSIRQR